MNEHLPSDPQEDASDRYSTHEVQNQARQASGFNAFAGDVVLRDAIKREAPWAAERCETLGALAGDENAQDLARLANKHLPELKTHDRFGNRIDWVDFHPSWHELMSLAWKHDTSLQGNCAARELDRTAEMRGYPAGVSPTVKGTPNLNRANS